MRGLAGLVVALATSMLPGCREDAQQSARPTPPPSLCAPEMQRYEVVSTEFVRQRGDYIEIEVVPRYQEAVPVGQDPKLLGWNFHAIYEGNRIDSIGHPTLQALAAYYKENLAKETGRRFNGAILHTYMAGFDEEKRCLLANGLGIPYIAWGSPSTLKML